MLTVKPVWNFIVNKSAYVTKDISGVRKIPKDIINAGKIGIRCSHISKKEKMDSIRITGISVIRKGLKPHLPGIFAGAGLFVPVPFGSVAGYGLGKVFQRLI